MIRFVGFAGNFRSQRGAEGPDSIRRICRKIPDRTRGGGSGYDSICRIVRNSDRGAGGGFGFDDLQFRNWL